MLIQSHVSFWKVTAELGLAPHEIAASRQPATVMILINVPNKIR